MRRHRRPVIAPFERIFRNSVRSLLESDNPVNRLLFAIPLVDQNPIARATGCAIKNTRAEH